MYTKLENIVNDLIIEEGKTSENDFLRYFKLGLSGLKEFNQDIGGGNKVVEWVVDPNTLTVPIPPDYVKYVKIGVYGQDGDIHPLGIRNQKSLIKTTANSTSVSGDELHPTYFEYVQEYGLGGGNNVNGYYKIDYDNSVIHFSSDLSGNKVIIEYISNNLRNNQIGEVVVHDFMVEAMKTYIYWKSVHRKRGVPPMDKDAAKRDYYNQKRLAKARMSSFTKQEALQTSRKGFKQAPKL